MEAVNSGSALAPAPFPLHNISDIGAWRVRVEKKILFITEGHPI